MRLEETEGRPPAAGHRPETAPGAPGRRERLANVAGAQLILPAGDVTVGQSEQTARGPVANWPGRKLA